LQAKHAQSNALHQYTAD